LDGWGEELLREPLAQNLKAHLKSDEILQQFWRVEEVQGEVTLEEQFAGSHFSDTHYRTDSADMWPNSPEGIQCPSWESSERDIHYH